MIEDKNLDTDIARQKVADTASDQMMHVKATVAEQAGKALTGVKFAAQTQLERQKKEITKSLRSVDRALRQSTQNMSNPTLAPHMERIADALSQAGNFLDRHHVEDIASSARQLSLRQPALFYTGVFAIGLAAGRFLSATEHRVETPQEVSLGTNVTPTPPAPTPIPLTHNIRTEAVSHGSY